MSEFTVATVTERIINSPDDVISTVMLFLISTGDSTIVRAATVVLVVKKVPELIIAVYCLN